jgi:hypothetical protein
MAKFGKRSTISENLNDFTICLLGEAGIGKTSTIAEACEKEFGADGYMILDMGKEQGMEALEGYTYETCEDWKKFDEVTKDIIKNKTTDYPDLKVLVIDTLDQFVEIMTPYVINLWNKENLGKKNFEPAKTMNAAWSGFGKADDKLVELALNRVWELKRVGVNTWFTGHVKMRNKVDPLTQEEYSVLSTDISQRIFEGFKTKFHVIGIACIDRTIDVESTGRKNIVTKKEVTVSKVKEEKRKIVFRDDNYSIDSKSRLSAIEPEIALDADELLRALKDAIKNSKKKAGSTPVKPATTESTPTPTAQEEEVPFAEDDIDDIDTSVTEEASSDYPEDLDGVIRTMFKECKDADLKAKVKAVIAEYGKLNDVDEDGLKKIYDMMK